ncbi:MAG: hypothetical protein AAFY50_22225 [Cyanobacteria bacterium J06648_1]
MKISWQKLVIKIFLWLLIEVILNFIGIDNLADYCEFLLLPKVTMRSQRFLA